MRGTLKRKARLEVCVKFYKTMAVPALLYGCLLYTSMAPKKSVDSLDRTLRDLHNDNRFMGGITFLFAGDFRQTLPVVTRCV